jgi:hypothetical protein
MILLDLLEKIKILQTEKKFNPFDSRFGKLENTHSDLIVKFILADISYAYTFFDVLGIEYDKGAKFEVFREKYNIDILIEFRNQFIIIENKIGAKDQPKQLQRYSNTLKNQGKNINLFYLTPYGQKPGDDSKGNLEVKCISYEKHIINWLENAETKDDILRTLTELYIDQIRRIINRNKYMTDIIKTLFLDNTEYAKQAINIYLALQGKNLLVIPELRERFENIIKNYMDNQTDSGVEDWGDTEDNCRQIYDEENDITITFSGVSIYAEKKGQFIGQTIECNDLNDINLQHLLTDNIEGVNEWLNKIYYN